jgi:hypothetical protein
LIRANAPAADGDRLDGLRPAVLTDQDPLRSLVTAWPPDASAAPSSWIEVTVPACGISVRRG